MARWRFLLVPSLITILSFGVALARDPKPFARSAEVRAPMATAYRNLRRFFSPESVNGFQIVEADAKKGIIKAQRDSIDTKTWGEWAYCKTSPLNLLDSLRDGTVKVKVMLEKDGSNLTHVSVTPDFEGEYSLAGSNTHVVNCESLGVLEEQILNAAGPSADNS